MQIRAHFGELILPLVSALLLLWFFFFQFPFQYSLALKTLLIAGILGYSATVIFKAPETSGHSFKPLLPWVWGAMGLGLLARIIFFESQLSLNGDNALYILIARNWTSGKGVVDQTGALVPDLTRLGFEILLWPFFKIFGFNLGLIKGVMVFLSLLAVPAAGWAFRPFLGNPALLWLMLLVSLQSKMIFFSSVILTETVYGIGLLFLLGWWARREAVEKKPDLKFLGLSLVGILMLALIREQAAFFLLLIPFLMVLGKSWKSAGVFAGAAISLIVLLLVVQNTMAVKRNRTLWRAGLKEKALTAMEDRRTSSQSFFLSQSRFFEGFPKNPVLNFLLSEYSVVHNVTGNPTAPTEKTYMEWKWPERVFVFLVWGMLMFGMARRIIKGPRKGLKLIMEIHFLALAFAVPFLFAKTQSIVFSRYLFPLIPFVLFYVLYGLQQRKSFFLLLVVFFLLTKNLYDTERKYVRGQYLYQKNNEQAFLGRANGALILGKEKDFIISRDTPPFLALKKAAKWIRENTEPGTVTACRKAQLFSMLSERPCIQAFPVGKKIRGLKPGSKSISEYIASQYFRGNKVKYYIMSDDFPDDQMVQVMRSHQKQFEAIKVFTANTLRNEKVEKTPFVFLFEIHGESPL